MPCRHHLVELTVLDRVWSQCVRKAVQAVYDYPVSEAMPLPPCRPLSFRIWHTCAIGSCSCRRPLLPSARNPDSANCIHLDYDTLVFWYFLDIAHPLQISLNRLDRYSIFFGKLFPYLFALDVLRDDLWLAAPDTTWKLAAAILAFILLFPAFQAVLDHFGWPAEKAFFPCK